MSQKTFLKTAGALFAVVGVLHVLRLLVGWEAVIGGWVVPHWVSLAGLLAAGTLAVIAWRLSR